MPDRPTDPNAAYEERRERRRPAVAQPSTPPRSQSQSRAQGSARRELHRLLIRDRVRFDRIIIQIFTGTLQRIILPVGNGRTLSFARIDEGTQMDIVDEDDETMVLTIIALAVLRDGEEVVIARTELEVTTRDFSWDDDDNDSDCDGEDEDNGSGSGESDSCTSDSSVEQGEEQEGDSEVESDSDQESYQEEIHGREVNIDLNYEGTLALLASLADGEDSRGRPRNAGSRVTWADEESDREPGPLPALYIDRDEAEPHSPRTQSHVQSADAIRALYDEYDLVIEPNDTEDLPERGNVVFDGGVFETLVDSVQHYRRNPGELDRNGFGESATAPFRRAGVDWRELVDHFRAQNAEHM